MAEAETAQTEKPARSRKPPRRKVVEAHLRSYFDALGRRDPEEVGRHWREDGIEELVPLRILRGRGEIVDFFRTLMTAAPDMETTLGRLVADETHAVAEWRMTGTFTGGSFEGIEPNGRRLELRGLDLFEVEDGEIVSNTAYWDGMAFARQVGMMPPQDSGAERAMKNAFNTVGRVRKLLADRTGG